MVKLEQLKGEVERALQCVYEGLGLFGLGFKDWVVTEKDTILKPKPKLKPKPNSKRLGLVTNHGSERKPKIQFSKVGSYSGLDEGCRASSFPNLVFASSEVVLISVASPKVVLLSSFASEDI
jgi:hypothetical protein